MSQIKSVVHSPGKTQSNAHLRFGQYDKLVRLEQEKRELQRALDKNKKSIVTGMQILQQKVEKKKQTGAYQPDPAQATRLPNGYSVEDYRLDGAKKAAPKYIKPFDINDVEPKVLKSKNMMRIRHQNIQNIACKRIIDGNFREREAEKKAQEDKAFKALPKLKRRVMPNISVPPSMLPQRYVRGELPCTIEHGIKGQYLSWAAPLDNLDYEYYLPIFFDGLQCKENPARFIARQGIEDLLYASRGYVSAYIAYIELIMLIDLLTYVMVIISRAPV